MSPLQLFLSTIWLIISILDPRFAAGEVDDTDGLFRGVTLEPPPSLLFSPDDQPELLGRSLNPVYGSMGAPHLIARQQQRCPYPVRCSATTCCPAATTCVCSCSRTKILPKSDCIVPRLTLVRSWTNEVWDRDQVLPSRQ